MTKIKTTRREGKPIAVIGGGIFGALSALQIADKGYSIMLIEKAPQLITGASLVNQCRVHMGYHYPRDEKTAKESRQAKEFFEEIFESAIHRDLNNHYLVAKDGSLTSPEEFLSFCRKMDLPYEVSWPPDTMISRDKIALSLKVPETIFDANVIRKILSNKVEEHPGVTLMTSTEVVGINEADGGYKVTYKHEKGRETVHCSAVVNASYGNINHINKMINLPLKDYQYELCEVPVALTPWKGTGWSIIDGPFFGVMPFGFAEEYLLYDVELSVLERVVGKFPEFRFDVDYYDDDRRRAERFSKYQEKWKPWLPEIEKCKHLSSMYATRIVLPKKEKTDTRPTMINELRPGFWQIFSGKITTSVPQAIELATLVDKFLKKSV